MQSIALQCGHFHFFCDVIASLVYEIVNHEEELHILTLAWFSVWDAREEVSDISLLLTSGGLHLVGRVVFPVHRTYGKTIVSLLLI